MVVRLALTKKFGSVKIRGRDNLVQMLMEKKNAATSLRSCEDFEHRTNVRALPKSVKALPPEYGIQEQLLERREDPLSRGIVVASGPNRFESTILKQILAQRERRHPRAARPSSSKATWTNRTA